MENNFSNEPLFGEENAQQAVEQHPNFIESNTAEIFYDDLLHKCIVPTFSDNTLTISHPEFVQVVGKAAEKIFEICERDYRMRLSYYGLINYLKREYDVTLVIVSQKQK